MSASSTSPDLGRLVDGSRAHALVSALAGADCAGRAVGTPGEQRTVELLAERLRAIGGQPLVRGSGLTDPFACAASALVALPTLNVTGAGGRTGVLLRDFCVDVQGAAGSGSAAAETVWLGARADTDADELPAALQGRIGVCWAAAATTKTAAAATTTVPTTNGRVAGVAEADPLRAAFDTYLRRVRRVRDAGARGLLQIAPRADRFKVMAHCHETPSIPVLDVTPEIGRALFAPYPPAAGQLGAAVELSVDLAQRTVHSAGNLVASFGGGPVAAVLVAHHDHLGALPDGRHFAGAADNAAGVAAVLEAATAIGSIGSRLQRRLLIVLSAAEEAGMHGAARFVAQQRALLAPTTRVICVDEIAGQGEQPLPLLASAAWRVDPLLLAGCRELDVGVQLRPLPAFGFADHVPFIDAGCPLVACLTDPVLAGVGPEPTRDDVAHTLRDTPDRVDPARLAAAARALIALAMPALG